jgi:putative ABC transport system permease protein
MQMDLFWSDAKQAWRNTVRRPAFTLLVALTLALGIGVNSAVFALLDGVLLRPLPYRQPSALVFMWQTLPRLNVAEVEATPFDYDAWRTLRTVPEIAMLAYGSFSITGGNDPERVKGARVTASLMPTLGLVPAIGRGFIDAEDGDEVPRVVILADGLWRRRFAADPSIVGRQVEIDGASWTVVGIMPRGAILPGSTPADSELWLPMRMSPSERANDLSHSYTLVGRLAAGTSLTQATAEFEALGTRLATERQSHRGVGVRLVPFAEQSVRVIRPTLIVAAASVALLLLVATANASTLLLARASNRRAETAVRAALGASRSRLLSQALVEGVLLASLGALIGVALGEWTLRLLIPLFGPSLSALPIAIGPRAALFSFVLAFAIGTLFGVIAVFHSGPRLADALGGVTRSTASKSTLRTRHLLVISQVALAVVLLSAAGLMLSSVAKLSRVGTGFDVNNLLTFRVALSTGRYSTTGPRALFVANLLERLSALPGIQSSGAVSAIPFGGARNANGVEIEGRPVSPSEPPIVIDQRYASPNYFQTMRIPLLIGRGFAASDDERGERVVVINRTMARRYFPNGDAVNRRVRATAGRDAVGWLRIVGVVDDVRHISLSRDPVPEMYHPFAQTAPPTFTVVLRTAVEPAAFAAAARAGVVAVDPTLPIYEVLTMKQRVASSLAQTRGTMLVLVVTAVLAASLAAIAIYGSIWYAVVQRQKEIGIRMALGASRAAVFRGVVGGAIGRASIGAVVGAAVAIAGGSLLRSMLFETRTSDPLTYALVTVLVLAVAVMASVVPARRAMTIDPMSALRNE